MNRIRLGRTVLAAVLSVVATAAVSCGSTGDGRSAGPSVMQPGRPTAVLDAQGQPVGLAHHRRWSEKIGQGGEPQGDVAFRNLAAMGYTTVLSVDGGKPDAEAAARWGLRYVHVPIEYSGITRDQELRIVQAVRTADGPVYVHCHHGLHRGPAGAEVARMGVEGVSNAQANEDLKASGCSPKYAGLYRDVLAFVPPTEEEMAKVPKDLPAYVMPGDFAEQMAVMSRAFERVQDCQKAGWAPPADAPDVSPAHEATILMEHFREMQRLPEARAHGDQFLAWLGEAEACCTKVETSVAAGQTADADAAIAALKKTCDACHAKHRDK